MNCRQAILKIRIKKNTLFQDIKIESQLPMAISIEKRDRLTKAVCTSSTQKEPSKNTVFH